MITESFSVYFVGDEIYEKSVKSGKKWHKVRVVINLQRVVKF